MRRKGISPILASVLLMAVTLTVVSVFSGWAPSLAKTVTGDTTNKTQNQLECDKASIELISANYDGSSITTVNLRNRGTTDLGNVTVLAFDSNDAILDRNSTTLNRGSIKDIEMTTGSGPSYVQVYTKDCGSVTDRLEDIQ